jgi:hypothetical protein
MTSNPKELNIHSDSGDQTTEGKKTEACVKST